MLVKKQNQTLTFNNGAINVLEVDDRVIRSNRMENIHYHQDAKSFSRFWKAYAAGVEIKTVISIPFIHSIKQNDVVELTDFSSGEKQIFEIKQLSERMDTAPRSYQLTLVKGAIKYVDRRTGNV